MDDLDDPFGMFVTETPTVMISEASAGDVVDLLHGTCWGDGEHETDGVGAHRDGQEASSSLVIPQIFTVVQVSTVPAGSSGERIDTSS